MDTNPSSIEKERATVWDTVSNTKAHQSSQNTAEQYDYDNDLLLYHNTAASDTGDTKDTDSLYLTLVSDCNYDTIDYSTI